MFRPASHFQTHRPPFFRFGLGFSPHLLVLLLSIALATPARAQWVTNGRPICTAPGSQGGAVVVGDGVGGVIVFWADYRSGDGQIYGQRVNQAGIAQWPNDGVVICELSASQYPMAVVGDGIGGAIIAWTDDRNGPTNLDIYIQRVSVAGIPQWATDGIAVCAAADLQYWAAIISDELGGAILAWDDERNGDGTDDVYAQRVNSLGVPQWGANGLAICTSAHNSSNVQVLADGIGGALIAWEDLRNGHDADLYAQRVTSNGDVLWADNGVAVCDYGTVQWSPRMVSDGFGGAIVAWEDAFGIQNEDTDVYAQRIDANGTLKWAGRGLPLSNTPFYNQGGTVIVSDGAGGAIVSWHDAEWLNSLDIRVQRINGNGSVLWTNNGVLVTDVPDEQWIPVIAADGSGGAIITWQDGYLNNTDIFAQRIDEYGASTWVDNGIAVSIAVEEQDKHAAVSDGVGGVFVAWTDTRNGANNSDIYVQRVRSTGQVTAVDRRGNAPDIILGECMPNPFSYQTQINVDFLGDGSLEVEVYDVTGRVVRKDKAEQVRAGSHSLEFDGRDQTGKRLPSGVYFYRVNMNGSSATRKVVIAR